MNSQKSPEAFAVSGTPAMMRMGNEAVVAALEPSIATAESPVFVEPEF
jgi:hypothetical protein